MSPGVGIGPWRFRPGVALSIVAAALFVLTLSLGNWQTRRAEEKLELARRVDHAAQGAALAVPSTLADAARFEHRRVSARGRYIARSTFFLDNKVHGGVAGYHVLTPLRVEGGTLHVLVNRGWIAAGDRRSLPLVPTPEELQIIEGTATVPGHRFLELAPESESGRVRQNLVLAQEQQRLGLPLQPFVVQQTSEANDGLIRSWERPDTDVGKHRSYALQWYSFAALTILFYVVFSTRRIPSSRD